MAKGKFFFKSKKTPDKVIENILNKKAKGTCTAVANAAVEEMKMNVKDYAGSMSQNRLMTIKINNKLKRVKTYENSKQLEMSVSRTPTTKIGSKWVSNLYYNTSKIHPKTNSDSIMKPYMSSFSSEGNPAVRPESVIEWIEEGTNYRTTTQKGVKIHVVRRPAPINKNTAKYVKKILKSSNFLKSVSIDYRKTYDDNNDDY